MEGIGLNSKLLFAQLFNFVLFLFIFKKYMAGPFIKFVEEERRKEKEREEAIKKAEELKRKEEEILKKAREKSLKEMEKAIQQVKEEAKRYRENLLNQVKAEIEREKERLRRDLDLERKEFEKNMKKEVYKISIVLVEKALKDYFDESKKKEFTQYILKNLKEIKA